VGTLQLHEAVLTLPDHTVVYFETKSFHREGGSTGSAEQLRVSKKNFRKADDWPPPCQPQLLLLRCCLVRDLASRVYVWRFSWTSIKTNGSWFVKFWQIQNWRSMTRQSESCPNFLWGVRFTGIFLLLYASSPAILGDLVGSRVSESCDCSASDVFHSRTKNLRSGRSIPHDLLVIRDHWCQKKREPIATANSVKSIVESSWFLKKVDYFMELLRRSQD